MNCGNLTDQLDRFVNIIGYRESAIRGPNISFSCSEGFLLSGPNTATCMGNGEWEPDPEKQCAKVRTMAYTFVHNQVKKQCIHAQTLKRLMIKDALCRIGNES